jgi:hypothetical protein
VVNAHQPYSDNFVEISPESAPIPVLNQGGTVPIYSAYSKKPIYGAVKTVRNFRQIVAFLAIKDGSRKAEKAGIARFAASARPLMR